MSLLSKLLNLLAQPLNLVLLMLVLSLLRAPSSPRSSRVLCATALL